MFALILVCVLVPVIAGLLRAFVPMKRPVGNLTVMLSLVAAAAANAVIGFGGFRGDVTVFEITPQIRFFNRVDDMGCFFSTLFCAAFILVAIYSTEYFRTDENKNKFDCFFLLSFGALMALCYSGNLLTMYITFEMATLCSMPLVLHDKTKESVDAAMKYLIYSIGGAFLGFIGVVYLSMNVSSDAFIFGGSIAQGAADSPAFCVILLLMLIGFGAKCGMFPLHNWLPTAHPVAPAPASALLSAIITKTGIIAIIRIVLYTVGADRIRGTWVHMVWIVLILVTILLGSYMAVIQKNFKKRLAFSTVSQVSYVLLGIAMFTQSGLDGAILQIASHATIKTALFLVAGALIHTLGIHDVDELDGAGRKMPVTMWCYTICSLGLVGVPPTSGFVAKWYLAQGALDSGLGVIGIIAPVVLIISAILTAYYLLSCSIRAFFPADKTLCCKRVKEPAAMVVPLIILAALTVAQGLFATPFIDFVSSIM